MTRDSFPARFLSSYVWTKERADFGGYSAITLTSDGRDFILLSDRAHVIEGTIFRHGDTIIGVRSKDIAPLDLPEALFDPGRRLRKGETRDPEGLGRDARGRLYLSLETDNVVLRKTPGANWERLPDFAGIAALPPNRGLEALAVTPGGDVLVLPEISDALPHPFPVFRYREGSGWDIAQHLTRRQGFVPVGADIGPDGQLYVLERAFDGFGFSSRVRRFPLSQGDVLDGETLLVSRRRHFDNLEGLAVWRTNAGDLRLTMVSDDNFKSFQRTEIVEYGLP